MSARHRAAPKSRRRFMIGVLVAALVSALPALSPDTGAVAAGGTVWGSTVERRAGEPTYLSSVARSERYLGRSGVVRVFNPQPGPKWTPAMDSLKGRGIVYSNRGNPVDVARGKYDQQYRAFFAKAVAYLKKYPTARVDYTFWHEPEDDVERGVLTAAQWRAANRHIIALQKAAYPHARLYADTILMSYTMRTPKRNPEAFYVPQADVLSFDAYLGKSIGAGTPSALIDPLVRYAKAKGKPWAIAEVGVSQEFGSRRLSMITAMSAYLKDRSPVYVSYFNTKGESSKWNWPVDDTRAEASAWLRGIRS